MPPVTTKLPDGEEVHFTTGDGLKLAGWFLPARLDGPGAAILVANGNAGNRAHRVRLAEALADAGASVLLFDYRGYGGNPGPPSENGLHPDGVVLGKVYGQRKDRSIPEDYVQVSHFKEGRVSESWIVSVDQQGTDAFFNA